MNSVSSDEILSQLLTNTKKLDYKNTKKPIADNLIKFIDKFPESLKPKAIDYINSNLRLSGFTKRQSLRSVDINTLMGFLNIDYTFYTQIYFENIKMRNELYSSLLTSNNEGLYGFQYMYYLLKNQDPSIKFTTDQIKTFNDMMKNVNDFMIYYIYIYIIFYNPFSILKRDKKVSQIFLPTDINGITQFNLKLQLNQGMGQKHENYTSNIFSNFNYIIRREYSPDEYMYINIRELENYGFFIVESTVQHVGAEDLIAFAKQAYDAYNKEFLEPHMGGMMRNKKLYKTLC